MDVIAFFIPNIIAGMCLMLLLNILGRHIMARDQVMDVMLIGQSVQTGILLGAVIIMEAFRYHDNHGLHLEVLISLLYSLIIFSLYEKFIHYKSNYRIEMAIFLIVIFMASNHVLVLMSPLVEYHMTKGALGDIVTAKANESYLVASLSMLFIFFYRIKRKQWYQDTFDLALYKKCTQLNNNRKSFLFVLVVTILIGVHLFGIIFTLSALLIPSFMMNVFNYPQQRAWVIYLVCSLCVPFSFIFLVWLDKIPPTVLISFTVTVVSFLVTVIYKNKSTES